MSMTAKFPNFFILGAPKCGTTSLASWLGDHASIYMSQVKEPNYFNSDVKMVGRMSDQEYQSLFDGVADDHLAVGEATTGYLRSKVAVEQILQRCSDARFIICIRSPIEMAVSFHGEMAKSGIEVETDFATAWALQESRRHERRVPRMCLHKEDLLYGPVCKLGEQIERVAALVNGERLLVIALDDIKKDPGREYRRTLEFLGVPDDGRSGFPTENQALHLSPRFAAPLRAAALVKRKLKVRKKTGATTFVRKVFGRREKKVDLSPDLRQELIEYFRPDVEKLEKIIGRDLSGWLRGGATRAGSDLELGAGNH